MRDVRRTTRLATLACAAVLAMLASAAGAAERYWPPIVDPPTNQHTPGRWVWADLVTSDVAAAAEFYGQVFGWTYETYGSDDDRDTYTLVLADGLPIGGMVFDQRAQTGDLPSARWIGLVSVPDVDAAAAAVAQHGGKVVVAPKTFGERGETAVFQDPEGVPFAAVRSRHGDPSDYAGDVNEWLWLDLWARDVERAAKFYSAVVGYEVVPLDPADGRGAARFVAGGFARAGVRRLEDDGKVSAWLPYVRVADVAATADRARAAGGRVLWNPVTVGPAVVAIIADPTGAPVGIAQLTDAEASR